MQDAFLTDFWRGLKFQMPYITAYLVGMVIALYYRRRYPTPCLCVFLACCVKMIVAVAYPATEVILIRQQDFATYKSAMTAFGIVDASAYGLLFLAAFHGRRPPPRSTAWHEYWDEDDEPPPRPPLPPGGSTEIQGHKSQDERGDSWG
jgi:hypothetical protein